jgi:hypothetical protein
LKTSTTENCTQLTQDLINWMKKTDAKNRQEMWARDYRVERRLNQPKHHKGASCEVVVSRLRTGTHEQHIDTS